MVKKVVYCKHEKRELIDIYYGVLIYRCRDCSLVLSGRHKKRKNGRGLYKDFYRNEIPTRFRFGLEYLVKQFRLFRAFKLFTIHPKARSILDIGSGRGFTLYFLKKYFNYDSAIGTQLCPSAVNYSRKKLDLEIYDKDLLKIKFTGKKFDLITMWHVLEHVKSPEKYIEKMFYLLKPDGRIVIEVPNYDSWSRKITGGYWLGMDLKYHLTFFTPETLPRLLKSYGFKIIKIRTFSLEYSTFVSVQSLVSWFTKTDQLFFLWLQAKAKGFFVIMHILLFLLLTPVCLLVNLLLYRSKSGEVLLITAGR